MFLLLDFYLSEYYYELCAFAIPEIVSDFIHGPFFVVVVTRMGSVR